MTTTPTPTPTPGDLSARTRLLNCAVDAINDYAALVGDDHDVGTCNCDLVDIANGLAALSALPAGGGAVETIHIEVRECDCGHVGINDCSDTNGACHDCEWQGPDPKEDLCPGCGHKNCMGAACPKCGSLYRLIAEKEIATTPQPSAAEDAAVGAQGDGLRSALVRLLEAYDDSASEFEAAAAAQQARDALAAAPAAGKGVDVAMVALACNCASTPPTMPTCRSHHLATCPLSALARQPVAGDGE